jgi:hypothetical protein
MGTMKVWIESRLIRKANEKRKLRGIGVKIIN